jgi:hypothetical protein
MSTERSSRCREPLDQPLDGVAFAPLYRCHRSPEGGFRLTTKPDRSRCLNRRSAVIRAISSRSAMGGLHRQTQCKRECLFYILCGRGGRRDPQARTR